MSDILIGLAIIALLILGWWVFTHHKPVVTASGRDLADTVAASATDAWEAVKRDLPEIVSSEVAQLKTDLAATLQRAQQAEAALAAETSASQARLAAVQAQVGSLIAGISTQPAASLIAPAQTDDVATA